MKNYAINFLIPFLLFPTLCLSQSDWQWGIDGGSTTKKLNGTPFEEPITDMATDAEGNLYIISTLGGENLSLKGANPNFHYPADYFGKPQKDKSGGLIMSYDCEGNYRWSKLISGTNDQVLEIETDTLGNVYVVGGLGIAREDINGNEYPHYFDTDTIIPYSANPKKYKKRAFLLRYDTMGTFEQLIMPEQDSVTLSNSSRTFSPKDLVVDPNGIQHWMVYTDTTYQQSLGKMYYPVIEGDTLQPGVHILKYDHKGIFLESLRLDTEIQLQYIRPSLRINHDPVSKSYYMSGYNSLPSTGTYQDSLWIGGELVDSSMFVAKFDSLGKSEWLKQGDPDLSYGNRFYNKPEIDHQGNIYLAGQMKASSSSPNLTLTFNGFSAQNYTNDPYGSFPVLIKMDPEGNLIWGTSGKTENNLDGEQLLVLNGKTIELVNSHGGISWGPYDFPPVVNSGYDMYLARFNKETGAVIAMDSIGSDFGYKEISYAITANKRGDVFVGGSFQSKMYVGNTTLKNTEVPAAGSDFFLVKYGENNCNCTLPEAKFTVTVNTDSSFNFTYTGSNPYDELEWGFGDGNIEWSNTTSTTHTYTDNSQKVWACVTVYNACGYDSWCQEVDLQSLDTGVLSETQFSYYPNPVRNQLQIETKEALRYTLFSMTGKQLQSGKLQQGHNQVELSKLSNGLYMLMLENQKGEKQTVKVVKRN